MLNEFIIDLILAFHSIVLVIVYGIMHKKRGIKTSWFFIAILFFFASIFFFFRHFDSFFRIIGNLFYLFAGLTLGISIFDEYRDIFHEKFNIGEGNSKFKVNGFIVFSLSFVLLNSIQIFLNVFLFITSIMMMYILIKKTSITHVFMFLAQITGFFTLIFSLLYNYGIVGAWEIAYYMKILLYNSLLFTGLTAPTEERLNKSERKYRLSYNRAEFYKDIFAHDISNILHNIQSITDLYAFYQKNPPKEEELTNLINLVKTQIIRGRDLVSNIRKISEIDEEEKLMSPIEVNKVLKQCIKEIRKEFEETQLKIKIHPQEKKYYVLANDWLNDVFENILINAIEHNKNELVEINIKISKVLKDRINYIKFEFIDNGIGIPEDMKSNIFQRTIMEGKKIGGRGLGLSLVQKIINQYNGKIWVEDRVKGDYSQGSKFILLIPAADKVSGS